ncbi:unnamed protein product [Lampetra planeri]
MAQVNVQAYMESHRVHHLFKEMLSMLLLEMPHQPIPWLINHLQAKLEVSRCAPPGWALPYGGAEDGAMVLADLDPAAYPSNVGGSDEEAVKSGSPPRSAVAPARSCETRKSHFVGDPGGGGDGGHDSNTDDARLQTGSKRSSFETRMQSEADASAQPYWVLCHRRRVTARLHCNCVPAARATAPPDAVPFGGVRDVDA